MQCTTNILYLCSHRITISFTIFRDYIYFAANASCATVTRSYTHTILNTERASETMEQKKEKKTERKNEKPH